MAAATATADKWIAFDMDECIAQLGVLYYFLAGIPKDSPEVMKLTSSLFAEKEAIGETWIVRPALRELLPFLGEAKKSGALTGVIVYSNNGSQMMVEFVGDLIDVLAGTPIVVSRLSSSWPEARKGAALSKNLEFLQKHVSAGINAENLLFFDDLPDHTLSHQLIKGNYVQVTPYKHQMDVKSLTTLFGEYINMFSSYAEHDLVARAMRAEARDEDAGKLFEPMDIRAIRAEKIKFRGIFMRFLGFGASNTKTRRAQRKFGAHSRKCRRHRQLRSRIQ